MTPASATATSSACSVAGGWSGSGVVTFGDVFEPGDDLAVVVGFLECDVCHEPAGCGPVPVLFAGLDVDDVAGADLVDLTAAGGDVADAVGDVEGLPQGVVVPGGACAGGESHVGAADGGLVVGVADAVDVDGAGEPVPRSGGGLAAASRELHAGRPPLVVGMSAVQPSARVIVTVVSCGASASSSMPLRSKVPKRAIPFQNPTSP